MARYLSVALFFLCCCSSSCRKDEFTAEAIVLGGPARSRSLVDSLGGRETVSLMF